MSSTDQLLTLLAGLTIIITVLWVVAENMRKKYTIVQACDLLINNDKWYIETHQPKYMFRYVVEGMKLDERFTVSSWSTDEVYFTYANNHFILTASMNVIHREKNDGSFSEKNLDIKYKSGKIIG